MTQQEKLMELAQAARKAAKVQYLREKGIEERVVAKGCAPVDNTVDTALVYSQAHVAASILADAKEAVANGSTELALDWINKVSVLLFDIAGLTHTSPRHREYGTQEVEEAYAEIEASADELW